MEWGIERQRWVDRLTLDEARWFLAAGTHFAPGSMAPKIEACIEFLEAGGSEAIITTPDRLEDAIAGKAGTHIVQ